MGYNMPRCYSTLLKLQLCLQNAYAEQPEKQTEKRREKTTDWLFPCYHYNHLSLSLAILLFRYYSLLLWLDIWERERWCRCRLPVNAYHQIKMLISKLIQ